MKKLFISIFAVLSLVAYSLFYRNQTPKVSPNLSAKSIQTPTKTLPAQSQPTQSASITSTPLLPTTPLTKALSSLYKDGSYTGDTVDAYYGNVQVQITVTRGKISDVQFLQYPNDRSTSVYINSQAMPDLKQEAIQDQNANVDIISGATFTSQAFVQSLISAIDKAKG